VSPGHARIFSVIDHIGISCSDYPKSQEFYDAVVGVLGMAVTASRHFGSVAAADENAVRAFHQAAVELGSESLHPPRLWPE
jgi:catechol 2,3-dioxygenase-like lactoylglutathione lyase family enzyme